MQLWHPFTKELRVRTSEFYKMSHLKSLLNSIAMKRNRKVAQLRTLSPPREDGSSTGSNDNTIVVKRFRELDDKCTGRRLRIVQIPDAPAALVDQPHQQQYNDLGHEMDVDMPMQEMGLDDPPAQDAAEERTRGRTKGTVAVSWTSFIQVRCCSHLFPQSRAEAWLTYCDAYLDELLALEGNPSAASDGSCPTANCTKDAEYRCQTCTGRLLLCGKCIVDTHSCNPFHSIQVSFAISIYSS